MEIERKFLLFENKEEYTTQVFGNIFPNKEKFDAFLASNPTTIMQGYLTRERISDIFREAQIDYTMKGTGEYRIRQEDETYTLTMKSKGGLKRQELEFPLTQELFESFWRYTQGHRIHKQRSKLTLDGLVYEFDHYQDRDLTVVEVELPTEDTFCLELGEDITERMKYKNFYLSR